METDAAQWAPPRGVDKRSRTRAAGLALTAGGVLVVASEATMLALEPGSVSGAGIATKVVRLAAFLLILLGLPGLSAAQRRPAGRLWGTAYVTAFLGTALIAGDLWFEAFAYPFLMEVDATLTEVTPSGTFLAGAVASFFLFLIGWAAVGVAGLRHRALPLLPSALLVLAAVVGFPAPLYEPRLVPWGLAVAWLGLHVARSGHRVPSPANPRSVPAAE